VSCCEARSASNKPVQHAVCLYSYMRTLIALLLCWSLYRTYNNIVGDYYVAPAFLEKVAVRDFTWQQPCRTGTVVPAVQLLRTNLHAKEA
jgi:hypothetical protein